MLNVTQEWTSSVPFGWPLLRLSAQKSGQHGQLGLRLFVAGVVEEKINWAVKN